MRARDQSLSCGGLLIAALLLLVIAGGEARADIIFPHYFTASQEARNVALELVLEPIWVGTGDTVLPRCDVELHRQAGDGAFVRLFHGPLGEAALECPCPPEDQPRCCQRRCRTFVDVCPAPDRYTYRATLLDPGDWSDGPDGWPLEASLQVWPSTGTCEAPPDAVISNEGGCGCRTGLGAAWPHAVVLLIFGSAALAGLRRQGQPGSAGSGTAKQ